MEARVSRLEDDMKEIKSDLKTVLNDLSYLKGRVDNLPDLSYLKGKIDNLPTTLQLLGFAIAVFACAFGAAGLSHLFGR